MPTVETETPRPDVERRPRSLSEILPPYRVILHNDDVNTMDHVVRSIVRSVPKIGLVKAAAIMLEAHHHGKAVVTTCPKELAELYRDRLQSFSLRATIEPA